MVEMKFSNWKRLSERANGIMFHGASDDIIYDFLGDNVA